MDNLEYLKNIKEIDEGRYSTKGRLLDKCFESIEYRKIRAFEIIAEERIETNQNLCHIITTLENIETAIKQR